MTQISGDKETFKMQQFECSQACKGQRFYLILSTVLKRKTAFINGHVGLLQANFKALECLFDLDNMSNSVSLAKSSRQRLELSEC